ncbi:MAG: hypothetical protein G01um101448_1190 [Parcubacteria group bacterium Gr01-1014_48]|nr:MAG: hypothetical protein G01um101448_1190 [Parcubacteria group bacterium Gr01-1014_48]TSD00881.1 MAG: hypothetical protein Greene101415_682 [Parcubacteria group bacterium Greene1014_15]
MSEGEPIIDTEPPMDASMSAKSQEAVADLERQLGSELSEEEAAAKLRHNTDMQGSSAAQKKEGKERAV